MKKLKKMLSEGAYDSLYMELDENNFFYDIENFTTAFDGVKSEKKYAYLTYAIARNETPNLHLLLCDLIYYTDRFFYDVYTMQKWHLKRALEISPNNIDVLKWITTIFNEHPDSPFSKYELAIYNKQLESIISSED
ncbi:MAG: hypothetical protein GX896_07185 [Clostridiales bacterium]|nr:hypothetical protein [Clostridiales bacterium]